MSLTVNLDQARTYVIRAIKAGLVAFLEGPPAAGKSAVVRSIAEEFGLKLIDLRLSQCDPTDLLGFPCINDKTGRASYAPMDTFPLEGDEVPDGYNGWLVLFDEITSAPRGVQAAAYKVLHEKEIGHRKIHPQVAMVAAGNREQDNAVVEPMSTALQSRLIHLEIAVDHKVWLEWAMRHGIDHRITSYVQFKPEVLYTFHPDHTDKTYASPRTWEYCSRLIGPMETITHDELPLLAGTISEGVAREFHQFTKVYTELPTIDQIMARPTQLHVPDEPSILYALTGSMASHASSTNIDKLMPFMNRLPKEFQVVCLREVVRRNETITEVKAIKEWISANAAELF